MPYLNLDLDYFSHPKIIRLIGLLGPQAEILPIKLWAYCAKYHAGRGELPGYSAQEVEAAVGWAGESAKMVEAMLKINLLEKITDGYKVHDWLEHAGHLAAFKKRAKSAAKSRWLKYASSNALSNRKPQVTNTPTFPNLPNLTNKKKRKIRVAPPQEAIELTDLLSNEIFKNIPNRTAPSEAQLTAWAWEAEKISRIDGHPWNEIRDLIKWCQADSFWKSNILSMQKLRKQWNQLVAKKKQDGQGDKAAQIRSLAPEVKKLVDDLAEKLKMRSRR